MDPRALAEDFARQVFGNLNQDLDIFHRFFRRRSFVIIGDARGMRGQTAIHENIKNLYGGKQWASIRVVSCGNAGPHSVLAHCTGYEVESKTGTRQPFWLSFRLNRFENSHFCKFWSYAIVSESQLAQQVNEAEKERKAEEDSKHSGGQDRSKEGDDVRPRQGKLCFFFFLYIHTGVFHILRCIAISICI